MEDSTPRYQGKPTAYLDHNILDLLVKNPTLAFKVELKDKYQILYSDENLKEIKRTGENGTSYLKLFNELGAMYLKLVLTPQFEVTGDATITELDSFVAFDHYCENIEPIYENLEQSMSQSLLKFYGGRSDANFDDIKNGQIDAFDDLMIHLQNLGEELQETETNSDINAQISAYTADMKKKHDSAVAQSTNELRKHVDDESNNSGVKNYRNYTGIGPMQLNNIEPPNVIKKIWEAHSELDGYKGQEFSIEQFYGISLNPIYDREMFFFEKVTSIYNVLNVVGFHPDSKMKKERRFTAAMSDAGHASIGSFADYVFSRDLAFVKKTRACYEFLNTKSQVIEVTVRDV
mgnify:CR=1 FL=1